MKPTLAQTSKTMYECPVKPSESDPFLLFLVRQLQDLKRYVLALILCLPTSLFALILLLLLIYNGFSVFDLHLPFPAKSPAVPANFSPGNSAGESMKKGSSFSSSSSSSYSSKLAASVMYARKEEKPSVILKTQSPLLRKSRFSILPITNSSISRPRRARKHKRKRKLESVPSEVRPIPFSARIENFFAGNSTASCKFRFFMTRISMKSFGDREVLAMESLFKSHPNACLVIVSNSMKSSRGSRVLKPFLDEGFRVMAINPDYDYIFKNTHAEAWFDRLRKGIVDPGVVSLGQNLSNLLRLALLYKFGGIYVDTDVIVLRSFSQLRNVIGAQTIDDETGNWSRLNNAVLIFDKNHPLLYKFIEEFALTFDGNKWGHNGPYLVSRVVSRLSGRPGFNFTVLLPSAFYPVDWSRIRSLFRGPRDELHSKWLLKKLRQIQSRSLVVHLWNRQSRKLEVEKGSIISHIVSDCCIFCNSALYSL
ncbi:lactosylceramide 4-alpha-galactosyltransferase-like [Juglans microcarpa x Juglans regia]|uniref:lactosylceramide 4-alpha-galactosyltransferase-like n=1 Tax=Juglans microcarpa x Juglans regia TaxID=2249226 RepID=UPI001B7F005B|nr:lactosylceramide 4-alpha-galactosyltransferase-like [Juglans microcarpa x Juglans regia]